MVLDYFTISLHDIGRAKLRTSCDDCPRVLVDGRETISGSGYVFISSAPTRNLNLRTASGHHPAACQ